MVLDGIGDLADIGQPVATLVIEHDGKIARQSETTSRQMRKSVPSELMKRARAFPYRANQR